MLKRVVSSDYYGYRGQSIKLTLECGHNAYRKASQGIPRGVHCRYCKHIANGGTLDALSSVTTALREMIETFEQPRFGGVYSMCLKRSREALAAGIAVLARKHSRKD